MKEFRAEKRLCPKLFTIEAIGRSLYYVYRDLPPKHQGYLFIYLDHEMCRNFDGGNI